MTYLWQKQESSCVDQTTRGVYNCQLMCSGCARWTWDRLTATDTGLCYTYTSVLWLVIPVTCQASSHSDPSLLPLPLLLSLSFINHQSLLPWTSSLNCKQVEHIVWWKPNGSTGVVHWLWSDENVYFKASGIYLLLSPCHTLAYTTDRTGEHNSLSSANQSGWGLERSNLQKIHRD